MGVVGDPRERVMLVTIRVDLEDGTSPLIVAREHQLWPSSGHASPPTRAVVCTVPDDVLSTIQQWLSEFLAG